jgi:hypothetical protein
LETTPPLPGAKPYLIFAAAMCFLVDHNLK